MTAAETKSKIPVPYPHFAKALRTSCIEHTLTEYFGLNGITQLTIDLVELLGQLQ